MVNSSAQMMTDIPARHTVYIATVIQMLPQSLCPCPHPTLRCCRYQAYQTFQKGSKGRVVAESRVCVDAAEKVRADKVADSLPV